MPQDITPPAHGALPAAKLAQSYISPAARLRESVLGRHCEVLERSVVEYSRLGDFSYIGNDCMVADASIGRFCAIAAHVRIGAPNHPMERPSQHRFTYCPEYYDPRQSRDHDFFAGRRQSRVEIGNDVWIGHGVIVLPGVRIGDGAVLAAGAVVSRDVAPYTVVGGVPARRLKERFPPALAARLQALAWWDHDPETILANVALFREIDISAFCDGWERLAMTTGKAS